MDIANKIQDPYDAPNITRTTLVNISAIISFNHPKSYNLIKTWNLFELDKSTYSILNEVDLSSNPTHNSTSLIFPSNTLKYGLYKIKLTVYVFVESTFFQKEQATFIRIIPTGISVYALEKGIQYLTIGRLQGVEFKPSDYSFDPDLLANISELTYKFYCRMVPKSQGYVNYLLAEPSRLDLETVKESGSSQTSSCFSSSGKLFVFEILTFLTQKEFNLTF